ncbi:MAG: M16 family metallopeptidase [Armatimonadota bacterium]
MRTLAHTLPYALLCLLLIATGVKAQPEVSLTGLPNGLRVIVCTRTEAPLVSIHLRVHSGSAADAPNALGAAHACEHIIFSGTTTRGPGEMDNEIEGMGASLQATTTRDTIQLSTVVSKSYWEEVDALIADAVQNPTVPEKEFDREQLIILQELARRSNEPRFQAEEALWPMLLPESPYAHPIGGTKQSVLAMKRDSILQFIRTHFVPNNCTLVLTGDITPEEALPVVRKHYGNWTAVSLPPVPAPQRPISTSIKGQKLLSVSSQRTVAFGFVAPGVAQWRDALACDALLYLLSAPEANLKQQLLHDKLASQVDGRYTTSRWPTLLYLSIPLGNQTDARDVEQRVLAECSRLTEQGPTPMELSKAIRQLAGQQLFTEETLEGQSTLLGLMDSISDYRKSLSYITDLQSLSIQEVQTAARNYLVNGPRAIVTVEPMNLEAAK